MNSQYIKMATNYIQRKEATKMNRSLYRKKLNLGNINATIISSSSIQKDEHAKLILTILSALENVVYIGYKTKVLVTNIEEINFSSVDRLLFLEDSNRFEYLNLLDFYLYFDDYQAYEYLLDTSVFVLDPFNANFCKTIEQVASEFCLSRKKEYKNSFECLEFFLREQGFNEKHIKFFCKNNTLYGNEFIIQYLRCLIEDNTLREFRYKIFQKNRNNVCKGTKRIHMSFIDIL